jgi:hypothetical protein
VGPSPSCSATSRVRCGCWRGCAAAYGQTEDEVDARLDETFFEPAHTRCGTEAWNAAARDGSLLSFDAAIAYGLAT